MGYSLETSSTWQSWAVGVSMPMDSSSSMVRRTGGGDCEEDSFHTVFQVGFVAEGRLENHVDHSYHIVFRAGNWRWMGWQNGHKKRHFFSSVWAVDGVESV